jgi:LysM repeat protein
MMSTRVFGAFALVTVLVQLAHGRTADAQEVEVKAITHKVRDGDTLDLLAAEYYGSRDHAIFIMKLNGMTHKRSLVKGEKLRIPVSYEIITEEGDTLKELAKKHLGDERRAEFLASFNNIAPDATLPAGQPLIIPFHVTHEAESRVSLRDIAAAYYRSPKKARLLREYNFLDKNTLEKGESILIPIYHVQIQASKLPARSGRSSQLIERRKHTEVIALERLPDAKAEWRAGRYHKVLSLLAEIDLHYLPTLLVIEVGLLRGSAQVATNSPDEARATFKLVLERAPGHRLDPYDYSPRICALWKQAGGQIAEDTHSKRALH